MGLEPCGDSALAWLADDPVPYPDLAGQLDDREIASMTDIEPIEEYL